MRAGVLGGLLGLASSSVLVVVGLSAPGRRWHRVTLVSARPARSRPVVRLARARLLEDERDWTAARLTDDDEVVVYCPDRDEREFGDAD